MPILRERLASCSAAELTALFEKAGLPFAPIRKPEELFDDEHLNATGGLADITLPDGERAGQTARTTLFPSPWTASAWACACSRRLWASTRRIAGRFGLRRCGDRGLVLLRRSILIQ